MAQQSKITISFSREYQDVYEFLLDQVNVSSYVCKVVRERMGNQTKMKIPETNGNVLHNREEGINTEGDLRKSIEGFD